uniref:Uncharacterized protein n=1 Tax=Cantharellus appalachiensis TaxID=409893 RepID=A0A2S0S444_9AGAM|nr:hypothetical protein [Cantharellus appalachiensis]AWA82118.1 hypothetical protein [Cantharellus appalachiensis]
MSFSFLSDSLSDMSFSLYSAIYEIFSLLVKSYIGILKFLLFAMLNDSMANFGFRPKVKVINWLKVNWTELKICRFVVLPPDTVILWSFNWNKISYHSIPLKLYIILSAFILFSISNLLIQSSVKNELIGIVIIWIFIFSELHKYLSIGCFTLSVTLTRIRLFHPNCSIIDTVFPQLIEYIVILFVKKVEAITSYSNLGNVPILYPDLGLYIALEKAAKICKSLISFTCGLVCLFTIIYIYVWFKMRLYVI